MTLNLYMFSLNPAISGFDSVRPVIVAAEDESAARDIMNRECPGITVSTTKAVVVVGVSTKTIHALDKPYLYRHIMQCVQVGSADMSEAIIFVDINDERLT